MNVMEYIGNLNCEKNQCSGIHICTLHNDEYKVLLYRNATLKLVPSSTVRCKRVGFHSEERKYP